MHKSLTLNFIAVKEAKGGNKSFTGQTARHLPVRLRVRARSRRSPRPGAGGRPRGMRLSRFGRRTTRRLFRLHGAPVRMVVVAVPERRFGLGQPSPGLGQPPGRITGGTGLLCGGDRLACVAHGLYRGARAAAERKNEAENPGSDRQAQGRAHISVPSPMPAH